MGKKLKVNKEMKLFLFTYICSCIWPVEIANSAGLIFSLQEREKMLPAVLKNEHPPLSRLWYDLTFWLIVEFLTFPVMRLKRNEKTLFFKYIPI